MRVGAGEVLKPGSVIETDSMAPLVTTPIPLEQVPASVLRASRAARFVVFPIALQIMHAGPRGSATANLIIIHNSSFSLTIEGTDIASGQPFEYLYAASSQTITPEPGTAALFGIGLALLAACRRLKR